jgi:glycosyltransferase involved in cell wall biosynthesis
MIKVLHLDTGRTFRGGQRQLYLLIQDLKRFNIEQYLACPFDSPLVERTSKHVHGFHSLSHSSFMRFIFRGNIKSYITEHKIDIIHAHDSHAHSLSRCLAGRGSRPVLIVTRRSSGVIGFGSRMKYNACGIKYIAISNHIKDMLMRGGVAENAIDVISSMIDSDLYKTHNDIKSIGTPSKKIILSAGAFDEKKGYYGALRAISRLKEIRNDFEYYLYGDGPKKEKYLKYIKKNGLSEIVRLPGWYDEPADCIPEGDIFLSPSHQEGLNMSIVEAMAMGVPVVSSSIPPHRENIKDGKTGLLFPPGDIDIIVKKLNLLLDDSKLARELITNARKIVIKYDCGTISERIYNLYKQMVA